MTTNPSITTDRVLSEVLAERIRQDQKWGEQNHPDGTGPRVPAIVGALCWADEAAERARLACQTAARKGETTWRLVFAEEALEALAEKDPATLRAELVQVAAVAVAWIEAIDRRTVAAPLPDLMPIDRAAYDRMRDTNPRPGPCCQRSGPVPHWPMWAHCGGGNAPGKPIRPHCTCNSCF